MILKTNYITGFNLCDLNMCYKKGHYISKFIGNIVHNLYIRI